MSIRGAVIAAIAFGVPAAGLVAAAGPARGADRVSGQRTAAYVQSMEGVPYRYGGTTTRGFDCSGLTQYVYGHFGTRIPRTAQEQFERFRPVSESQARSGDLVFFHETRDPSSPVYHVGVYEGGDSMVAASSSAREVTRQSFAWAGGTVTFGTITH